MYIDVVFRDTQIHLVLSWMSVLIVCHPFSVSLTELSRMHRRYKRLRLAEDAEEKSWDMHKKSEVRLWKTFWHFWALRGEEQPLVWDFNCDTTRLEQNQIFFLIIAIEWCVVTVWNYSTDSYREDLDGSPTDLWVGAQDGCWCFEVSLEDANM